MSQATFQDNPPKNQERSKSVYISARSVFGFGNYSIRVQQLATVVDPLLPRLDYAKSYVMRLAYYADAVAKKFDINLIQLGEYIPDGSEKGNSQIILGYAAYDNTSAIIRLLLRAGPPRVNNYFYAEPHLVLVLSHELAHVIVHQRLLLKYPVLKTAISPHGPTHGRVFLEVWKFLLPLMKQYHAAGNCKMGEIWLPDIYGPSSTFKDFPEEMWKNESIDMTPWARYALHCTLNGQSKTWQKANPRPLF